MKHTLRFLLIVLLVCSPLLAAAEKNGQLGKQEPSPSLLPVAPQAVITPAQKTSEGVPARQTTHLGHVDLARIAAESETGKTGQARLVDLKKKLQGQIETKRKLLNQQQAAIESKLKTLTPAQREVKGKEFQKKIEEFQKFGINAEKELQAKQEEFSTKLFKAIEFASIELGKVKNLDLVVIKRELLFLNSGVDTQDVTEEIIKKIDGK